MKICVAWGYCWLDWNVSLDPVMVGLGLWFRRVRSTPDDRSFDEGEEPDWMMQGHLALLRAF
jgi:hypothetical protein